MGGLGGDGARVFSGGSVVEGGERPRGSGRPGRCLSLKGGTPLLRVVDRAIQVRGAAGVSGVLPFSFGTKEVCVWLRAGAGPFNLVTASAHFCVLSGRRHDY
jgi:hypothetical protein